MRSPELSPIPGGATSAVRPARLAVVPGEGIGPSLLEAALRVLRAACDVTGDDVSVVPAPPSTARDEFGVALDPALENFYAECFAAGVPVLHGPAGGRFVYDLRARFDLFVKFTPIRPLRSLADAALIATPSSADADLLIIRDNAAGLYQGEFGWRDAGATAFHEATYRVDQVDRVLDSAIGASRARRGRLALIVKPGGVPTISRLWRARAEERCGDVELDVLEIDNACFQLIADPARFDVVVAPNMFGDIVGDTAALLLGTRGLSYSANFGTGGAAVYQTAHGAAHDLAGRDVANPIAQILTMAWLLRSALGLAAAAEAIESATHGVLASGMRTADCAAPGSTVVGTAAMAESIAERIRVEAR